MYSHTQHPRGFQFGPSIPFSLQCKCSLSHQYEHSSKPFGQPVSPPLRVGGAVAQSVECATPGEEVSGSIPAVSACSLSGWVGVSIM